MNQSILAGWTKFHLFLASALQQLSNSKIEIWWITQVNYHTLINHPRISVNTMSGAISVLFSTLNTDKPILRVYTEMGRAGLSLMATVFGVKEHLKEKRVILKIGWCTRVELFPHIFKRPLFLPLWQSPGVGESPWLTFGASHKPPDFKTVP